MTARGGARAIAWAWVALWILGPAALAQQGDPASPAPIEPPAMPTVEPAMPAVEPAPADEAADGAGLLDRALDEGLGDLSGPIKIVLLMTVLTFIPAMLLTLTSYTRIIIVLSFVRRAIGAPELPPNLILMGLALFLTGAIMTPTLNRVYETAWEPLQAEELSVADAMANASAELKTFMLRQTREQDLLLALDLARAEAPETPEDTPLTVAIPAFVLSELRTAFRMGFVLFLPFVLIDLVVASVLLALGMFMLPPTMVAMPLKILLFVLVDGWTLVIQSLTVSFAA